MESYSSLKGVIESQSGYSWLMCFLQILKQVERSVLVFWWSKLPQNNLLSFFSIFEHLLKQFQNTELSTLASLLALDCVDSFIRDFSQELCQDGNLLLNHIFGLLSKLMQSDNVSQEQKLTCFLLTNAILGGVLNTDVRQNAEVLRREVCQEHLQDSQLAVL